MNRWEKRRVMAHGSGFLIFKTIDTKYPYNISLSGRVLTKVKSLKDAKKRINKFGLQQLMLK